MATDVDIPLGTAQPVSTTAAVASPGDRWVGRRLGGLSRFAIAITILNVAGHAFLGFEQSWITPFVALGAAYLTEIVGESAEAWGQRRPARYAGSWIAFVQFLLPAHITALATGMLLYAAEQLWHVAFGASLAIASKYVFRVSVKTNRGVLEKHFLNPSNFGIAVVLLLFPSVGIAPPYQFTENTWGIVDWLLPLLVICAGTYLNVAATGRIPLIGAWLLGFAIQAMIRSLINETPLVAGLAPMTGFAFILFTFYMITDPATTPSSRRGQIIFGAATAAAYGFLMQLHVVFGLFFALSIVTISRGTVLWLNSHQTRSARTL